MIRIDRGDPPALLAPTSETVRDALTHARGHFEQPAAKRRQTRYKFRSRIWANRKVYNELATRFDHKCAYCESPIGAVGGGEVEHYRPKANCVDLEGNHFPDHYWWLAYDWENLLLSCRACNSAKGSRFPVDGPRATYDGGKEALDRERPVLIDPCSPEDDPSSLLYFEPDGMAVSSSVRGRTTIEVLSLNRKPLVEQRAAAAKELFYRLSSWPLEVDVERRDELEMLVGDAREMIAGHQPFAALRRQMVASFFSQVSHGSAVFARLPVLAPLADVDGERHRQVEEDFEAFSKERQSYSVADSGDKKNYYQAQQRVRRIEIENFRAISNLAIDLQQHAASEPEVSLATEEIGLDPLVAGDDDPRRSIFAPRERDAPWTMLLGENAVGKSSVMQAVAMTLMGQAYLDRLRLDVSKILHKPPRRKGERKRRQRRRGSVRVYLTGLDDPVELRFGSNPPRLEVSAPPKVLLLGYGSTRLLPRGRHSPKRGTAFARVDNLFSPFVPLQDANKWLIELYRHDRATFDEMAVALKKLLGLAEESELAPARGKDEIQVELHGTLQALTDLSDGYQSVLALATDVMAVMLDKWPSMAAAEGVVLLDEVGSHLHPRWRMRVVDSLRAAFPRAQFICTTHDPLCLRGLQNGEVVLMRRNAEHEIHALADLPPVKGLTVNQLLTSEHFGLASTMDPAVEQYFVRYSELLSEARLTARQKKELTALKKALHAYDLLGQTRRERLMLEAIDRHLARETETLGRVSAEELDRKLQAELDALLSVEGAP